MFNIEVTFAMTFILTLELIDPEERAVHQKVYELARAAGFREARHISRSDLIQRYFMGRPDGLQPASGEEFLVATT